MGATERRHAISEIALFEIGKFLQKSDYRFTTITPESHRRILARQLESKNLVDVFGWNREFGLNILPEKISTLVVESGMLTEVNGRFRSKIRFSTIKDQLFLHSGFPTNEQDSVFFGPDTYRYVRFLRQHVTKAKRVVDIGCGSGAGGLCLHDRVESICLADINAKALRYAQINTELAGLRGRTELVNSDVLAAVEGPFDLVIANPPFMLDDGGRAYRHGGAMFGAELSVRILKAALHRVDGQGKVIIYTASAFVDGVDTFWEAVKPELTAKCKQIFYEEIDPDIFGEELEKPAYQRVERLALVGLVLELD